MCGVSYYPSSTVADGHALGMISISISAFYCECCLPSRSPRQSRREDCVQGNSAGMPAACLGIGAAKGAQGVASDPGVQVSANAVSARKLARLEAPSDAQAGCVQLRGPPPHRQIELLLRPCRHAGLHHNRHFSVRENSFCEVSLSRRGDSV